MKDEELIAEIEFWQGRYAQLMAAVDEALAGARHVHAAVEALIAVRNARRAEKAMEN